MRIIWLEPHSLEAYISSVCAKGEFVFIPYIPMIPYDTHNYEFKRLQFSIKLYFVMTIKEAQGKIFSLAGIDLQTPCFSHDQLHVACFKVARSAGLLFQQKGKTSNVINPEMFHKLRMFMFLNFRLFIYRTFILNLHNNVNDNGYREYVV